MYSLPNSGEANTTTRYLVTNNLSRSRVWPNPAGMYPSPPTSQNSCCGQPTLIQVPTIDENKTQTSWPDMFGNSRHQIDTKRSQKQQAGPREISPLSSYPASRNRSSVAQSVISVQNGPSTDCIHEPSLNHPAILCPTSPYLKNSVLLANRLRAIRRTT